VAMDTNSELQMFCPSVHSSRPEVEETHRKYETVKPPCITGVVVFSRKRNITRSCYEGCVITAPLDICGYLHTFITYCIYLHRNSVN
jgi:hypothetical protein